MKIPQGHLSTIIKIATSALAWSALAATGPALAAGGPEGHTATPPKTLCAQGEVILFSCEIKAKVVSLCATMNPDLKTVRHMDYRFGRPGKPPELDYPKQETLPTEAFSFSSISRSFLLETISFSRGNVSYDVMTPDKADYVQWMPFTGIGITLPDEPTVLMKCNQGSVSVDLSPLKMLLDVQPDKGFSAATSKLPINESPYPVIKKNIKHGAKWTTKLSYPAIPDPALKNEVSKFVADCYEAEEAGSGDEGECIRTVSAKIINHRVLALGFDDYEYHTGSAHGYGNSHTILYRKSKNGWKLVKKDDVFDPSDSCQSRIGNLLYRRLKPLLLDRLEDGTVGPDDILDEADISLNAQGIVFTFQSYDLGAYAEGPGSIVIPYDDFGSCLRW